MCVVIKLLTVIFLTNIVAASRKVNVNNEIYTLAINGEQLNLSCEDSVPLAYCAFVHPNGTRFPDSGPNLNNGQCSRTLITTPNDSGDWKCHMGRLKPGVEKVQTIRLRMTNQIAAIWPNVTVTYGKNATLHCLTADKIVPINYCRFMTPLGVGFNINQENDENNLVLDKYFFPANLSIDRGDCAVTIKSASFEDEGMWKCAAWPERETGEYSDVIQCKVEGVYKLTVVSTTGVIIAGIFGILVFVAVFFYWRKRNQTQERAQVIEMTHREEPREQLVTEAEDRRTFLENAVEVEEDKPQLFISIPLQATKAP